MNCDQAFERLTDDQCADDAELARHLHDCPRCRDMQQTLSPAMDWLRTSDSDAFSANTIQPWRDRPASLLTEESVAVAIAVAQRLPRNHQRSAMHQALGIAFVAMFGMMLGVFVIGERKDVPRKPTVNVASPASAVCLWTRREGEAPTASAANVVDSCIACHVPAMMRN